MAWTCMASCESGPLVFIDAVIADRIRMNCDVYRAVLSAQIQPNTAKLIRQLHGANG